VAAKDQDRLRDLLDRDDRGLLCFTHHRDPLLAARLSAVLLGKHRIDHLHCEALLGFGEPLGALHLLLQLWVRFAFTESGFLLADERFDGYGEYGRQQ